MIDRILADDAATLAILWLVGCALTICAVLWAARRINRTPPMATPRPDDEVAKRRALRAVKEPLGRPAREALDRRYGSGISGRVS